ncbi:MAG: hypothetical protein ACI857_000709, partial [Arenicella sp.]
MINLTLQTMKKMKSSFFKRLVVLIAFTFTNFAFGADYYWVNGAGNWSDVSHWSLTTGGSPAGNLPGIDDDVNFDNSSFTSSSGTIVLTNNVTVNGFRIESETPLDIQGANKSITIGGAFIATENFSLNLESIIFQNTENFLKELNFNGLSISANVIFTSGKWELSSNLITTQQNEIHFNSGELKSNGFIINSNKVISSHDTFNFDFGDSFVYANSELNLSMAKKIGASDGNFFINEQEIEEVSKGDFSASNFTKDQFIIPCGATTAGMEVEIVTLDYIGGVQVSCNDSCNGELSINVTNGIGPFEYSFDLGPFVTTSTFPDLCPDNYLIIIRDLGDLINGSPNQCNASEILSPPSKSTLFVFNTIAEVCPGACDGIVNSTPLGGIAPHIVDWSNGESTTNPSNLCQGLNTVQITDANGCITDTSFIVPGAPDFTADATITEPTCFGDCDGEIDVIAGGGNGGTPYGFSWNIAPLTSGPMPGIGFCAGPLILTITDDSSCTFDTLITMTEPPVLGVNPSADQDASCFGTCDGEASANPFGGAGGNTFEWFTCLGVSTGITDENPTTLCAGDYYVVVTDFGGLGCSFQSACITIDEPTEIDATADGYQVSCFGVCDGSVDVDVVGGTFPYFYSWITVPGGTGVGATDTLAGLCAGFYEIVVTDDNGCSSTPDTVEVIEPAPVTVNLVPTNPSCYDLCDGSVIATPGGGTPPFVLTWTPVPGLGQGTATPSLMCAGLYDVLVTDDQGCTLNDQVTLNSPSQYDITTNQTDLVCAGDINGTIDVTINSGGSGIGYTYNWIPAAPIGDGTSNVSGLSAGIWCVTIADNIGCDTVICFTITAPTPVTATASVISHVSCFGDCDGSAQVVIGGGTVPYVIDWVPGGQNGVVASGLCQGNYTVTVTDDSGCSVNDNVTINEPTQFDLTFSQTDIVCFGDCNGDATVTMISGGTPLYNYQWDDPLLQTTPTAIGLCSGPVTVTVTDQNLCDTIISYTILEPAEIVIDTNVINSSCFGVCSGEAYITVVGGTGAYNFEWFDAITGLPLGINNDSITNLCPGQYYAQITDATLCQVNSDTMTITELPEIFTSVISEIDATCGICDGTAEVSATGGTGVFNYIWTPAPGVGQGTAVVSGLCAGAYNVVATDGAGCLENIAVTINSVALEVTVMDSTDITCFGLCDGTATVAYNLLDAPYIVEWFDNLTGLPIGIIDNPATQPSTASGLCAGEYLAVLTNASGCVTTDTIVVNEPPEITGLVTPTHVVCNGDCNGSAFAAAAGGTGILIYNWGPGLPGTGQGTPNVGGLCAGNWDVTVTDDQGCSEIFSTTISEPTALVIDAESSTNISCFGANNGTATVINSGGLIPYLYEWFDCNTGLPISQTTQVANNLGPGDYQVVITDDNGCTITSSCLPVIEPTALTGNFNVSPVNCFGSCDGLIDIVPGGGSFPYFFQWQDEFLANLPGQTNDTLTNVCQGLYNVLVTDLNGCSITFGPVDMTAPGEPWDVTPSQTDLTCSGNDDGTATVLVLAGNNPPYSYQWDDPLVQNTSTATNLPPGTYTVIISDASICDTTVTFIIIDANPIFANALITDAQCFGDCNGQIIVAPSGGNGTYTVNWSDLQTGNTAIGLCAGPITTTITDGAGCFIDTIINISEPTELVASSTFSNNATCGTCNGSATINVSGGNPIYIYDWTPDPSAGEGTNNATGLCPGVISVLVTDQNGCTLTEVFPISDVNAEVLTMDSTDVSCFG